MSLFPRVRFHREMNFHDHCIKACHISRPTVDISKYSTFFSFHRHISRPKVCISHFPWFSVFSHNSRSFSVHFTFFTSFSDFVIFQECVLRNSYSPHWFQMHLSQILNFHLFTKLWGIIFCFIDLFSYSCIGKIYCNNRTFWSFLISETINLALFLLPCYFYNFYSWSILGFTLNSTNITTCSLIINTFNL